LIFAADLSIFVIFAQDIFVIFAPADLCDLLIFARQISVIF